MISDRGHHVLSGLGADGTQLMKQNSSSMNQGDSMGHNINPLSTGMASLSIGNSGFSQQQHNTQHHFHQQPQQSQRQAPTPPQQQSHLFGQLHGVQAHAANSNNSSPGLISNPCPSGQSSNNYEIAVHLAAEANGKAMDKDFYEAIKLYGNAISLHPHEPRFYLNRSYCYAQLELYQLALDDSDQSIKLNPKSAKSYYRKGQALAGLKKYLEAEEAFQEALRIEPECSETTTELKNIRTLFFMSMGFTDDAARIAATKYSSIREGLMTLSLAESQTTAGSMEYSSPEQQTLKQRNAWGDMTSVWDHPLNSNPIAKAIQGSAIGTNAWSGSLAARIIGNRGTGAQGAPSQASPGAGDQVLRSQSGSHVLASNINRQPAGVIGSSLHSLQSRPSIGQTQSQLLNGFSSGGVINGSLASPVISNPSASGNGFMPTVGSNYNSLPVGNNAASITGTGFYHRIIERPNSNSPSDTDASINNSTDARSTSQSLLNGANAANGHPSTGRIITNAPVQPLANSLGINNPPDQSSIFDGSCVSKGSNHPYSGIGHAKTASSDSESYPKNSFNGVLLGASAFTNSNSNQAQQQQQTQQTTCNLLSSVTSNNVNVTPAGRHASGGTIGSFANSIVGNTNSIALQSGTVVASASPSNLEISPVSPAGSSVESENSNRKMCVTPTPRSTSNQQGASLLNKSSTVAESQTPSSNSVASSTVAPKVTTGPAWGSSSGGGTFADIVKKKSAPQVSAQTTATVKQQNAVNSKKSNETTSNSAKVNSSPPKDQSSTGESGSIKENSGIKETSKAITTGNNNNGNTNATNNGSSFGTSSSNQSRKPTNIWGYNGLRVANVSTSCSKSTLHSIFSKFGKVKQIERITNKNVENQIWVFYDNANAPVEAIAKYQGVVVSGVSLNDSVPLKLYFAATDDQKDLKFSRPKQPQDNRGECYYWRTTNCFSRESCSLLHIPACKNIGKYKPL